MLKVKGPHKGHRQKVWIKKYLSVLLGIHPKTVQDKWAFFEYNPLSVREYLISQGYRVPRPGVAEKAAPPLGQDPAWFAKGKRGSREQGYKLQKLLVSRNWG